MRSFAEHLTPEERDAETRFEASNRGLLERLPKDQIDRVFAAERCELAPDFLGFVDIYERLSEIIPTCWTVVDLGCANAAQAFFFDRHLSYIGVDLLTPVDERFAAANSSHFEATIGDYIASHVGKLDLGTTFAICSYVPPWYDDNCRLVRESFKNVFTYYPCSRTNLRLTLPE